MTRIFKIAFKVAIILIAAVVAGWGIFAGMRRWLRGRSSL